jgi:hypothetical protein
MLFLPVVAELAGEVARRPIPQNIAFENINLSWLGIMVGAVTAGLVVVIVFVLVGFVLVRYRVVKIGEGMPATIMPPPTIPFIDPKFCERCQSEHDRSKRNETDIREIKGDLKTTRGDLFKKLDEINEKVTALCVDVARLHPTE